MSFSSSSSSFGSDNSQGLPDSETLNTVSETESLVPAESERRNYCGCGPFRPRCLQWFARPVVYTILLCMFALLESCVVSGLSFVAVSTLEERYHISGTAMGIILSMFDATVTACVLFVSYFGGHGHRAQWLAVGEAIMGIGCLVFASPQFIFNNYKSAENGSQDSSYEICFDTSSNSSDCSSFNGFAYTILFLGQVIIGVGTTPLYTVGISYLDELVLPKYFSINLSAVLLMSMLGPPLGFGLGGAFLSIYIDPWKKPAINPSDAGWLGAWWIGFVFIGLTSLFLSVLFFLFPKTLSVEKEVRAARMDELAKKGGHISIEERKNFFQFLCTLLYQLKQLLTNVTFLFLVASVSTLNLAIGVIAPFAPKYVETVFNLPSYTASLLVGGCSVAAAGVGVVLGGVVVYFFKNPQTKPKRAALFLCIVAGLALPFFLGYLIHCPSINVVGVGNGTTTVDSLHCSADCGCSPSQYWPICGSDGLTYFSPCSAGCTQEGGSGKDATFTNCSCVQVQTGFLTTNGSAVAGACDLDCKLVGAFLVVLGVAIVLEFMRTVPFVYVTLRSVRDDERPLSLGVASALGRLFGTIPGPILGGLVFDSTCLVWQEECDVRGNCWLHDNDALYIRNMILVMLSLTLSFLTTIGAYVTYPKNVDGNYHPPDLDGKSLGEITPSDSNSSD